MDGDFVTKTLFWLMGTAFLALQGITGFLVRYHLSKNEKDKEQMKAEIKENKTMVETKLSTIVKDFRDGVDTLKSAVHEMKELIAVIKTQHTMELSEINRRLEHKRTRLDAHSAKMDDHEKRIISVEHNCKHYHK